MKHFTLSGFFLLLCLLLGQNAMAQKLEDFYTYRLLKDGGYSVQLTDDFKEQVNKAEGGVFTSGDYTWKTGDPLPNPAPEGMYNGEKVTSMGGMFKDCYSLTSLDLSSFNTANATSLRSMFYNCSNLTTLDLSRFNTAKVTDMSDMFRDCSRLISLNLSSFNTANATDMSWMFSGCTSLTTLDLSSFNTAKVTDMSWMFSECFSLTSLDLSSFNTAKLTDMTYMYYKCYNLTSLDLSNFNTEKVRNMYAMFFSCSSLAILDLSNFSLNNISLSNKEYMFYNCGINGTPVLAKDAEQIALMKDGTSASDSSSSLKFTAKDKYATGISGISAAAKPAAPVYDLQGRKAERQQRGRIYIVGARR